MRPSEGAMRAVRAIHAACCDAESMSVMEFCPVCNTDVVREARIIDRETAAPDMYDTLIKALEYLPYVSEDDPMASALVELCRDIRVAIAKAKGD